MKSLLVRFGRDSLVYGVGTVVTRFSTILLLPLFTRYLTPADFGTVAMLGILTMIAQPVFSLGLGAAMGPAYFEAAGPAQKAKVVWTAFGLHVFAAGLLLILGWAVPAPVGSLFRLLPQHAPLISLSITSCALSILSTSLTQRVQFEGQSRLFIKITALTAVISAILSVIMIVFLDFGIYGIISAQLIANLVLLGCFLTIALKYTRPGFSFAVSKDLLRLGFPMIPGFAFLFILTHGNKYILEWQSGLDALGIYSIGFNLGAGISVLTAGITTAWYPFFMRYVDKQHEVRQLFGKILTYYVFLVGSLCLLFFIVAWPATMLLTQSRYHEASVVIGLTALAHFFQGAFSLLLPGIYYQREVGVIVFIQALASVICIICSWYLVAYFDVLGAAFGLAVGNFSLAAFLFIWNRYRKSIYPEIDYEWRRVGKFCFVFSAIALANAFLPNPEGILQTTMIALTMIMVALFSVNILLEHSERRDIISKLRVFAG